MVKLIEFTMAKTFKPAKNEVWIIPLSPKEIELLPYQELATILGGILVFESYIDPIVLMKLKIEFKKATKK